MLAELDSEKGIGLIERVKQGQGRPAIIYLKKFYDIEDKDTTSQSSTSKNENQAFEESKNKHFRKSKNKTFGNRKSRLSGIEKQDFRKSKVRTFGNRKSRVSKIEM